MKYTMEKLAKVTVFTKSHTVYALLLVQLVSLAVRNEHFVVHLEPILAFTERILAIEDCQIWPLWGLAILQEFESFKLRVDSEEEES